MAKYVFDHWSSFEKFKNDAATAIITDIDGTISVIAPTPQAAQVSQPMRLELEKLKKKYDLVVVLSGRSVEDARQMVGVEGILYIGNHGLEFMKNGKRYVDPGVEIYLSMIREALNTVKENPSCNIEGILREDKGISFSVHYRLCKDPEDVRKSILGVLENRGISKDLKITEGKKVIEIRPPKGFNKGQIIEKLINEHYIKKVVYLGDDITDTNAFFELRELEKKNNIQGASILIVSNEIGEDVKKSAQYYLNSVAEVQNFFQWLSED
ncbi:MAG: trehalose-phosphatase [Methanobacteriaceae archaeon]|nr:trehalose-phosphatase [Methanobacteriaceae archaeon]